VTNYGPQLRNFCWSTPPYYEKSFLCERNKVYSWFDRELLLTVSIITVKKIVKEIPLMKWRVEKIRMRSPPPPRPPLAGKKVCFSTFLRKIVSFLVFFRLIICFPPPRLRPPWKIFPFPVKKSVDAHGSLYAY